MGLSINLFLETIWISNLSWYWYEFYKRNRANRRTSDERCFWVCFLYLNFYIEIKLSFSNTSFQFHIDNNIDVAVFVVERTQRPDGLWTVGAESHGGDGAFSQALGTEKEALRRVPQNQGGYAGGHDHQGQHWLSAGLLGAGQIEGTGALGTVTHKEPPQNKKNVGPFYLTSVSLAFCSPSAVASMTVNSFSSIELSNLSMC